MNKVGFRLLLITDGFDAQTCERVAAALGALPRGLGAVQLRAKELAGRALVEAARALVEIAHAHGAPLLVNDRADVALAAGADGVHLPARGLPSKYARKAIGEKWIGASTHSIEEARMQTKGGADYLTFGPVFPTASKAAFGPPQGLERLAEVCAAVEVPVFALGGVDASNARACLQRGARLACIGAVLGAPDVGDVAGGARKLASSFDS